MKTPKRIYFESDLEKSKPYWSWILALGIICCLYTFIDLFAELNWLSERSKGLMNVIGLGIITLYQIQHTGFLRYRNHVNLSDRTITLHLNSFWGYAIHFTDIKEVAFSPSQLVVMKHNGSLRVFDLEGFVSEDVIRLNQIFKSSLENSQLKITPQF